MIISNKNRRNKTVKPIKDESGEAELRIFQDESTMIDFIKSKIIYLNSLNIPLKEIAILVRASWLLIKLQNKLIENSIPYQMLRGTNFFERKEIKYTLYYISFKLNKDNEFLFKKICNYPKKGIGPKTIEKIIKIRDENNIDFIDASCFLENSKVIEFGKFLKKLIKEDDIVEFCNILLNEGGFEEEWKDEGEDLYFERKENFELLIKIAQNLQNENKNENIDIFQLFLSKVIPFYRENEDKNGVVLGTLHSSKGLEFEAVFLPYVSDTILPYKRYQQEADEEEERRLLYVGMTRAKSYLYLLHPSTIDIRGQKLAFSRLATQLIQDYLVKDEYQNNEFNIGEYIESKGYGSGKIIAKKRLRNGKILYIVETEDGTMQFIDGIHELRKKIFDY
ncbi:MAG: 3'-5' exonuclease [Exilispira sp.]